MSWLCCTSLFSAGAESPRWQFFSGQANYEDRRPCNATTLIKFRSLLGEEGVEDPIGHQVLWITQADHASAWGHFCRAASLLELPSAFVLEPSA